MRGTKVTSGLVEKQATKLRFPVLLFITAGLFVVDLLLPDFIPFVDELLLGLVTAVLATLKKRRAPVVLVQEPEQESPRKPS